MHSRAETKQGRGPISDSVFRNVLAFHKLTSQLTFGPTNYSPRRFSRLLNRLSDSGFEFVPLSLAVDRPKSHQVAITIDDGYAHLLRTLPIIIEQFGIKPTVFVPTAFIGKENTWDYSSMIKSERHLSKDEIRELAAMGVEFGSHGHTHRDLRRCTSTVLNEELTTSKNILEGITERSIKTLSYPFGRLSKRITESALKAGYEHAFTMNFPEQMDPMMSLGRIAVYFFDNAASTRQKLGPSSLQPFHKEIGRVLNYLSFGTILLNMITGRTGKSESAGS